MVSMLNQMTFEEIAKASSNNKQSLRLRDALASMEGDPPSRIAWIVRWFENPESPLPLPGKIDLYRHDCLHLLLDRGFSLDDEAFVVGFTMGNDIRTNCLHLALFKLVSQTLYPKLYRFNRSHLISFDLGVAYGRFIQTKNLNEVDFQACQDEPLDALRSRFGIDQNVLNSLGKTGPFSDSSLLPSTHSPIHHQ